MDQRDQPTPVRGVCRFCSGGCGVIFHTAKGEIVGLNGDPDHPVNKGSLCPKAAPGPIRGNPHRITRPLYRPPRSNVWEEISWEAALVKAAEKLKEARDACWDTAAGRTNGIAVWGSAQLTNEESYLLAKFARLLGTNHIESQARV